jgi:hypothetical protein
MEKRMTRGELIFPVILLVLVAAFTTGGYWLGEYSWGVIAFPLGAALFTCALCLIEIARVLTSRPVAATSPPGPDDSAPAPMSGLTWMFVLPVFLYGLGFVAGPALYLLACLRANGFSWALSAAVAAASVALTLGLFIHLMGILLPIMPLWWP